jgi:hypothetical protein
VAAQGINCLRSLSTGVVGSNSAQGMTVCMRLFCVVLCVWVEVLAPRCSPIQGDVPSVYRIKKLKKTGKAQKKGSTTINNKTYFRDMWTTFFLWARRNSLRALLTANHSDHCLPVFLLSFYISWDNKTPVRLWLHYKLHRRVRRSSSNLSHPSSQQNWTWEAVGICHRRTNKVIAEAAASALMPSR